MANASEITSIKDLLERIDDSKLTEQYHSHLRIWFRGHSDNSWQLMPGVYRTNFICADEDNRLDKEQHLFQDFRVFSASMRKGTEDNSELYFLQQHYGMPTKLLDWSNQPLAALFFAASGDDKKDGELFFMDAYQLAKDQTIKDKKGNIYKGIATGRNPVFNEQLSPITQWGKLKEFSDFILPVRPDHFDKRMSLQRSCFTFHTHTRKELTVNENHSLLRYTIPKDAKVDIMKELALLGIDHFNIYGDLENLAKTLKANYKVL